MAQIKTNNFHVSNINEISKTLMNKIKVCMLLKIYKLLEGPWKKVVQFIKMGYISTIIKDK